MLVPSDRLRSHGAAKALAVEPEQLVNLASQITIVTDQRGTVRDSFRRERHQAGLAERADVGFERAVQPGRVSVSVDRVEDVTPGAATATVARHELVLGSDVV